MSKTQTNKLWISGIQFKGVLNGIKSVVLVLLILGLSACGNKGDLYLPKEAEVNQEGTEETSVEENQQEKSVE